MNLKMPDKGIVLQLHNQFPQFIPQLRLSHVEFKQKITG